MSKADKLSLIGGFTVGTCQLMCPEKERLLREKEGLLHPLEILEDERCLDQEQELQKGRRRRNQRYQHGDPQKVVKCYSRSAAGQKAPSPDDLRPAPILSKTVDYLVCNIACRGLESEHWLERYNFVADRLRAVRQDMVIQGLPPCESIRLLEPMVKFHVFAAYWLCESPMNDFDATINKTFLLECMKRLLSMYDYHQNESTINVHREPASDDAPQQGFAKQPCEALFCENEKHLMEALYLVVNLGDSHALMRSLLQERSCSSKCRTCIQQQAMKLSLEWQCGNYVAVCRALRFLPPLVSMAGVLHLPAIHRYALMVMDTAYSSKVLHMPCSYLQDILLWPSITDVMNECSHYGIQCQTSDAGATLSFLKGKFHVNARLYPASRTPWLNETVTTESLRSIFSTHS